MKKASKQKKSLRAFQTEVRKEEHLTTVLNNDVSAKGISNGFETYTFEHCALPDIDFKDVDLSMPLFGKVLKAPILISSMTGGTPKALKVNQRLAEIAQEMGIAMGVGSQRAALENNLLCNTYQVRDVAPNISLFANFGAIQLNYGYGKEEAKRAIEMIEADRLFLHLNPLQEAVQKEGDKNWKGIFNQIEMLVQEIPVPIIVKEVGNGVSSELVQRLKDIGVAAVDIAGSGGTSWSEVEAYRQVDPVIKGIAHNFSAWGIPTAKALVDAKKVVPDFPIFASGGIRTGIDVAKAIRLGAEICGIAAPVLASAAHNSRALQNNIKGVIEELKIASFCTGSKDISSLRVAPLYQNTDCFFKKIS